METEKTEQIQPSKWKETYVECARCNGSGKYSSLDCQDVEDKCIGCNGKGKILVMVEESLEWLQ